MSIPLFNDILIVFCLSIAVIFLCHRLKVPAILGFLVTGVLAGPFGFRLIKAVHEVETLAEIGVIMLLFTIGVEFSLKRFFEIKKTVLLGGSLQVLLTLGAVCGIVGVLGESWQQAVFIGCLFSLSSTAIVLKLLQERAEVDTPHGRTSLGILIYQDIIIVPMMLFTPVLAGGMSHSGDSVLLFLLKTMGLIIFVYVSAKWLVPRLLYHIAGTRSRELFLLSILVICFGFAWLTSTLGLSLALGAFLAGLIISESEYGIQTMGNIIPFRDIFTSFFFVSIGMLLNTDYLLRHSLLIFPMALGVLFLKALITCLAVFFLGFPVRTAIVTGLALSQVGEFSFILSKSGLSYGLINRDIYQIFLAVSFVTMAATPFLVNFSHRMTDFVLRFPLPEKWKTGFSPGVEPKRERLKDHIIIVGFGVNGRNLASAAKRANIPYVIIEMNPETVRDEKSRGEPIYYGDATHEAVLHHADILNARVLMIAITDPAAARRMVTVARRCNPKLSIIVRTPYLKEVEDLRELGANEVIPEDFETSIEIFSRVLKKYLVPRDEIEQHIAQIRAEGYEMLRNPSGKLSPFSEMRLPLPDVEIASLRVGEKSPFIGKTLLEIDLRRKFGVTLLAVSRGLKVFSNPDADMRLWTNDVVILLGKPENTSGIAFLIEGRVRSDR